MSLEEYRKQIDGIDEKLVELFCRRMEVSEQIAAYKKENNMPIFIPAREREKLVDVAQMAGPALANDTRVLYSLLFELSRNHQSKQASGSCALHDSIQSAISTTPKLFPQAPMVACQGVEGAYSQLACEKIFKDPFIMYFKNFEGVFQAIDQGLCEYGVLPIENSTAGSVNKVYDLMMKYNFSIVRTARMKIEHYLLAKPGATLAGIRRIYSHEQAIHQCAKYLETMAGVQIIPVENTAAAAKLVSEANDTEAAAICSKNCAELYDLEVLESGIHDKDNNRTRFICISKKLEIYPGADKTSIIMTLPHRPGALYRVLARLYVLGINVTKLESRPIPDSDFEFMFYFDLDTSIYSEEFIQLICQLEELCETFKYLGSFSEVI